MKSIRIFIALFFLAFFYCCQNDLTVDPNSYLKMGANFMQKDSVIDEGITIAIISDIHVMDPSLLGRNGTAFQEYLAKDPKLLEYSSRILHAAVQDIISKKPDLVLIPGDLTKDGEKVSHETVIRILKKLAQHGIKVLVTVGNHDVNNPDAKRFFNTETISVPTVQAEDIPTLYADFGFGDAISKDLNSLSYVNEPIEGLWILCIDANRYYDNTTSCITGGVIKTETMDWIKLQLAEAQSQGKTVIGMMHHGLIEHYAGQNTIDPGYVIANSDAAVAELMDAGLKMILTGHYHATDITKRVNDDAFIFDVETGSTVNYPGNYRMLTIVGNEYSFAPQSTTALMGRWFDRTSQTFFSEHLDVYFSYLLASMFGLPPEYASALAPYFKTAAMAHFAGDEVLSESVLAQIAYLNTVDPSGTLGMIVGSLWSDINTPDNTVTIDMETGTVL